MTTASEPTKVLYHVGRLPHPMFKAGYCFPPEGFSYVASIPELTGNQIKKEVARANSWQFRLLKCIGRSMAGILGWLGIPRVSYIFADDCSIIHSVRQLPLNRLPWVIEIEDITALSWYDPAALGRAWNRRNILRFLESRHCRMILPWTDAARQSVWNGLHAPSLASKIRVVYPCVASANLNPLRTLQHAETTILWVGSGFFASSFYSKGGWETLLAFERLWEQRRHTRLVMVGFIPPLVKKRFGAHPGVKFLAQISNQELESCYAQADIFVMPTHVDTFGFVYLEAFAHGLPCVGTKHFAVPEIIRDGQTGSLVDTEASYFGKDYLPQFEPLLYEDHPLIEELKHPSEVYLERLRLALLRLVDDPIDRVRKAEAAYAEVREGRFSPASRMEALREVYESILG